MPIFQGGLPAARIRQAQAEQGQVLEQVVGTERAVVQAARAAFATYDAAKKAIQSETVAVQANELALEGARAEQSVGTRTVLDVLNAEQELLNSQVVLVTAKRDAYVAGFQLLNAMGQARPMSSASTAGRFTIRSAITAASQETGTTGRAIRATDRCDAHGQPGGNAHEAGRHAADRFGADRSVRAGHPGYVRGDSAAAISDSSRACSRPVANPRWKTSSRRSKR